jgi:hypothetical protein
MRFFPFFCFVMTVVVLSCCISLSVWRRCFRLCEGLCPLLWVIGWRQHHSMGWFEIFGFFFFFFLTAEGLCLEVGGFYGLIWQAMERLGIVDNDCAEMVVVVVLAQLG